MNENVKCNCEGWLKSADQIFQAQMDVTMRIGIQYTGDIFKYCPWCGIELQAHNVAAAPDTELRREICRNVLKTAFITCPKCGHECR